MLGVVAGHENTTRSSDSDTSAARSPTPFVDRIHVDLETNRRGERSEPGRGPLRAGEGVKTLP